MTTVDEHKNSIRELEDDLREKIRDKKIFERQKVVGFDISEAATNLFELYLHRKNLITEGYNVNHRFFSSMKIAESRFAFEFPEKAKTLGNLVAIEELTTKLCYGKSKKLEEVEKAIKLFFDFKEAIEKQIGSLEAL